MIDLYKHENELIGEGYKVICGVDEVGRGCYAGPLVACAVVMDLDRAKRIRLGRYKINDSKKLPSKVRKKFFKRILRSASAVGIGIVGVPEINYMKNINRSAYLARYRAVQNLGRSDKLHCHIYWHHKDQNLEYAKKFKILYTPIVPHYILVDGPYGMPEIKDIPVKTIIGGDFRSISIASASVIAKVYRDSMMINLSKIYTHYGWECNKGYGTTYHIEAIRKYGITPYHRNYFDFIKIMVEELNKRLDEHVKASGKIIEDSEQTKNEEQMRFEFDS